MTDSDLNIWGELVVPVGLLICFGPALFLWFRQERKAGELEKAAVQSQTQSQGREDRRH